MKSMKCKICKKEIKGWNKKMLDWNMEVHLQKHKRDSEIKSNSSTPHGSDRTTSFFQGVDVQSNEGKGNVLKKKENTPKSLKTSTEVK